MEALLLYIVKSGICLSLLSLGFICLLRNATWFRFNRSVILWGCLVCALLPFVELELREETLIEMPVEAIRPIMIAQSDATMGWERAVDNVSQTWQLPSFVMVTGGIYAVGCFIVFIITVLSYLRIRKIVRRAECRKCSPYKLYVSAEQSETFSWGQSIIVPKDMYDSKEHLDEILLHEISHLNHRHSIDIMAMQLFLIFHWFNPFVWLLRRELLDIHEYQADNDVINQGINATQYQLLLVKKAVGSRLYILANGFNHSKLKKRITMMLKKKTSRLVQLRALLFVPMVAGVIYSFAAIVPVNAEQNSKWAYPVANSTLAGLYGGQHKHSGIDLKANAGAEIKAAFDGVVVSSTSHRAYGKVVVVRHSNGLETLYAHNSKNLVKEGEAVKAGQVIALVGNTGKAAGAHCHFEIKKNGLSVDPESIFNTKTQTLRDK